MKRVKSRGNFATTIGDASECKGLSDGTDVAETEFGNEIAGRRGTKRGPSVGWFL